MYNLFVDQKYLKIIDREKPISKKYPQMSLDKRAAQFAPFAALKGFDDSIDEVGRETGNRSFLSEDQAQNIDQLLVDLLNNKDKKAVFTYFKKDDKKDGGAHLSVSGVIEKYDSERNTIVLNNGKSIFINDLVDIELL